MLLVSILTQVDFGQALIRFLPRAGTGAARLALTAYGLAATVAVAGATAVMAWCHLLLEPGDPLYVSLPFAAWFVVSTAAWSLFALQDSALTGLRAAVWIPLENGVYGLVKLGLLVVVAQTSVTDGLFTSWTLPVLALLVPVNLQLFRRLIPRHAAASAGKRQLPSRAVLTRYLAGGYVGHLAGQASSTFLPVLVVSLLGAAQGAYYLPAQTAFAAMGMLATAITSSLVVEAARDEQATHRLARAMLRRICVLVLPAGAFVGLAAPWLLELFGSQYRAGATTVLQLMMLSLLPRVPVALYVTKCRLDNRTGTLALLQFTQAALVIGGTAVFAPTAGLVAVGWSVLAAEVVPALAVARPVARWLRG